MSDILYHHFKNMIYLDQAAFSYGNIKPDLPWNKLGHHTLKNSLPSVLKLKESLEKDDLSLKDFSTSLGELCHYLCDFFCYYHLNEEIHNHHLQHALYELQQHIKLYQTHYNKRYKIHTKTHPYNNDIASIILYLQIEYLAHAPNMIKDIDYAISAAVLVGEAIIKNIKFPTVFQEENPALNLS
ncbi:MAG: zinc dependent phospholipase C family protein [Mobilitalea sp.]